MFFFTAAQRKYFVANEQDIEELSIRKIIIIDTGLFHIKRESLTAFLGIAPPPCSHGWPTVLVLFA